jgi:N-acylglucosamine 2-epimerase
MTEFKQYQLQYKQYLDDHVLPFWLHNSSDDIYGGFFTSLDREGKVFDTDKFIWLQARQVWTFAMLYNNYQQRKDFLDMVKSGSAFLQKYGMDQEGNWYFALNRKGEPLVQPYNIFSDCFAAMAFAQASQALSSAEYKELAVNTFRNIIARQENPKGKYNKAYPGTRPLNNFALPMILCNLVLELEDVLPEAEVEQTLNENVKLIFDDFYQSDTGLILENVGPDGTFDDTYDGRLINPGHGIEAMWFVMDVASRWNNQQLVEKAGQTAMNILEYGWDQKYGGIFYFMDYKNKPPQQLEWDQKLWWVHLESLIAMAKAFHLTGDAKYIQWFSKIHDYSWQHFADQEYGEWYGYLNRRGEILLPLKGGKWKGCFHVPRAFYQIYRTFEAIENEK